MTISYFKDYLWQDLSREERFYCLTLYQYAKNDPSGFASWIGDATKLKVDSSCTWDIGFEVCFYRDYLWHSNKSARENRFPPKRTFDLCLFSSKTLVVIEAKVEDGFHKDQNQSFINDRKQIKDLLNNPKLEVILVALASSKYFNNAEKFGRTETLEVFDGRLTWLNAYLKYKDPLFQQADELYGNKKRRLLSSGANKLIK